MSKMKDLEGREYLIISLIWLPSTETETTVRTLAKAPFVFSPDSMFTEADQTQIAELHLAEGLTTEGSGPRKTVVRLR